VFFVWFVVREAISSADVEAIPSAEAIVIPWDGACGASVMTGS
jgi:hypothetical protein